MTFFQIISEVARHNSCRGFDIIVADCEQNIQEIFVKYYIAGHFNPRIHWSRSIRAAPSGTSLPDGIAQTTISHLLLPISRVKLSRSRSGILSSASAEFDMYQPRVDYHADRGDADVEAAEQLSQMVNAYSVSVIAVDNPAITDR